MRLSDSLLLLQLDGGDHHICSFEAAGVQAVAVDPAKDKLVVCGRAADGSGKRRGRTTLGLFLRSFSA